MSGIEKKIAKLLKIAQEKYLMSNESEFQKNTDYVKFKSIKLKSAYSLEINRLIHGLRLFEFQEECTYWCKQLLKITDMCKKEDRNKIFTTIVSIYVVEEKHELVLKYCKEALENVKGTSLPKHFLEYQMGRTLMRLKKYREALQYFNNENLTYFINSWDDPQNLNLVSILCGYRIYIVCYMKNNRQFDILETMATITICKLNSEDPTDVKNECLKILTEWPDTTSKNVQDKHFCVSYITEICYMKCQLFKSLGDMVKFHKWASFLLTLYHDVHMDMHKYSEIPQTQNYLEKSLSIVINAIVTLVSTFCEPKQRKDHFNWLYYEMVLNSWDKNLVYYMGLAMVIEDNFIDLDDVIPFLQFFIKKCSSDEATNSMAAYCAKKSGNEDPNEANSEAILYLQATKDSMATFKNSLLINAHFKKVC